MALLKAGYFPSISAALALTRSLQDNNGDAASTYFRLSVQQPEARSKWPSCGKLIL